MRKKREGLNITYKFPRATCLSDGRQILEIITDTTVTIGTPACKQEAQRLVGLFG
jgi:hypothetical protein